MTGKSAPKTNKKIAVSGRNKGAALRSVNKPIVKQVKAGKNGRESEEIFRNIVKQSIDGITLIDQAGTIIDFNSGQEQISGIKRSEAIGKKVWDIQYRLIPDELKKRQSYTQTRAMVKEILSSPDSKWLNKIFDSKLKRPDGQHRTLQTIVFPIRLSDRTIYGSFNRDITELKEVEDAQRLSEEKYRALFEGSANPIVMFDRNGTVLMINATGAGNLGRSQQECIGKPIIELLPQLDKSYPKIYRQVIDTGKEVIKEDYIEISSSGKKWFRSVLQPVSDAGGRRYAVLAISYDITEQKKAEEALQDSEIKWSSLVNNSKDIIIVLNNKGTIQQINQTISSRKKEDIIGEKVYRFVPAKQQKVVEEKIRKVFQTGEANRYEVSLDIPEVGFRWFDTSVVPVKTDNRITSVILICNDITGRKQAEEQISLAHKKLNYLLESSTAVIYSSKASGNYDGTFISNNVMNMVGYKPEMFIKEAGFWYDHVHPEDRAMVRREMQKLFRKESHAYEYRFRRSDNSYIWVRDEMKLVRDNNGKPVEIIGCWVNINEKKITEQYLHSLAEMIEQSTESLVQTDTQFRIIYMNRASEKLFGWKLKEVRGKTPEIFNAEPESRKIQQEIYKAVSSGDSYFCPGISNRRKDGSVFTCQFKVSPVYDEQRKITGYMAFQRDITAMKNAEDALRESEEKFRLLFETMAQGVVYQDAKGEIVTANRAAEKILGLTLDQMRGRKSVDSRWKAVHEDGTDFPGETHPAMLSLKTGEPLHNVIMGVFNPVMEEYRWILISSVPLFKEEEKKPYQVYTTFDDITELKAAKEELEKKNVALGEVIARIETEKAIIQDNIVSNIQELILPVINKMKHEKCPAACADILEKNLHSIASKFGKKISSGKINLSPREIEICNYIRSGLSSKEIASILGTSPQTVEKQRKVIRKKMGIKEKSINLVSYLQKLGE